MTSRDDRSTGLNDLLDDVLESSPIEPELVERYERAPDTLSEEELGRVAAWRAASPGAADTLRMLEDFDPAALAREVAALPEMEPAAAAAADAAAGAAAAAAAAARAERDAAADSAAEPAGARRAGAGPLTRLWERVQAWIETPGGMGLAAAAAGLALVLLWTGGFFGPSSGPEAPGGSRVAEAPAPPLAPRPEAPATEARQPGAEARQPGAEARRPEAGSQQPEPGSESRSTPAPAPTPTRAPVPTPAPTRAPAPAPAPEPGADTPATPDPPSRPAPIMLAMALPDYRAPAGAGSRPHRFSTLRSGGPAARLVALAPDHVGRTLRPRPELYWLAPASLDPSAELLFVVSAPDADLPLIERTLPVPAEAGLVAIEWAADDPPLAAGSEYTWSVSWSRDPDRPELDVVARGSILRPVQPLPELSQLAPAQRPRALAAAGLWYDAFAEAQRELVRHPSNASAHAARAALVRSAGLEPALSDPLLEELLQR